MSQNPPRQPPPAYVSIEPTKVDERLYRCPICHEIVDSRDLDVAALHLEPGHERSKERELFQKMRRVKVWPMAPDREPDEKG